MPSNRLIITPPNDAVWHELRAADVTSTESATLFDMSPYSTKFELWHRKREKQIVTLDANERMGWGTDLQDAIAYALGKRFGVKVRRMSAYQRLVDCRMGSSFDFEIVGLAPEWNEDAPTPLREMYEQFGVGNLEIKNVDYLVFRDQWSVNEDKTIEAPGHIEIQVQHQLHVSERAWAAIGVLVGGNTAKLVIRERDLEVGQSIEARVREFWKSVDANEPPPPTYPGDAEFVCRLYGYAEPGKVFDGRGDAELATLAAEYQQAGVIEKQAKEDKDVAKAKLIAKIGDAERALLDGYTISAGLVGPTRVEYDRAGYRNFRLTKQKEKAAKAAA